MATFLLVSSVFLHALWNAFAKKSASPSSQVLGILAFATLFATAFIPFVSGAHFPNAAAFFWAIGAGVFEAGYVITLAMTFDKASLGLSYTLMRGGAMLFVWTISSAWLGEKVSPLGMGGVALVVLGLYLTSRVAHAVNQKQSGQLYAYVCAFFIAAYHLCYGQSLERGANPASLFALSLWIAVPASFAFSSKENLAILKLKMRRKLWPMILGGFICASSFTLFLRGLHHAGAGFALTLRNTSVIFAQIFAVAIGEPVSIVQWLGALLVAIGAAMVSYAG